ncbi:F-box/LRR-repeat protein [Camellia lanceoleosa]|uniref:F-box/LRR-repeat protein n=1 Tax=Camellia lanceoleosa TaxID=1840588 RepID=A0ACC0G4S9_9ERIC|nr:F-box/LRR-repeat protein [Camellia lanceoleosa]
MLVHLLLSQYHVLNVPRSVCFPNLKSLFLDSIQFAHGDSLERVLAGYPVLEELSLECVEFDDIEVLYINLPFVKLLMMRNCHNESQFELALDVPKLELLHYNFVGKGYEVKNLKEGERRWWLEVMVRENYGKA